MDQAAEDVDGVPRALDISLSTADRAWWYARAWLYAAMAGDDIEITPPPDVFRTPFSPDGLTARPVPHPGRRTARPIPWLRFSRLPLATVTNAPVPGLRAGYAATLNEAKALGSKDSTARTADQTQVAMLWRQALTNHQVWNRIAQDVAEDRDVSLVEDVRLLALMNMTLHDGLQTSFGA